jgi:hypothetical protein
MAAILIAAMPVRVKVNGGFTRRWPSVDQRLSTFERYTRDVPIDQPENWE